MKKIFTFAFALMAVAVSSIAEESITGVSSWSPWNPNATTIEVKGQQTFMNFTEAWSGAGYWMGIDEDEDEVTDFWADWSDYDYLVYMVADVRGSFNLSVEYHDDGDPNNNHATVGNIGTNGYGFVALDPDWNDYVAQTWIQPTAPGSITITDMVLMTKDEFEAFKESMKPTGDIVNLWKGDIDFNNSWPAIHLPADAFDIAEEGDRLIVNISAITEVEGWEWGTQIFCNNGAWRALPGMKVEGITETGEQTFILTWEQLDSIAATGGMNIQGMACKVSSVDLVKAGAVVEGTVLWEGTMVFDNSWPGIQGMGPELFADTKAGDKIVVTVASIDNIDGWAWGAQLIWKDGNWADLAGTSTASVSEAGDVTLNLTQESVDVLKANGFILQGMSCTVSKIMLVPSTTHVNATLATPADDVIYNICGQRVDASYKGLVIRNGKKYLNR
jgi:hypothetical protein